MVSAGEYDRGSVYLVSMFTEHHPPPSPLLTTRERVALYLDDRITVRRWWLYALATASMLYGRNMVRRGG